MLHVLLGAGCNNNCSFCMEEDRAGRAAHIRSQTIADISRMIETYRDKTEILFTSGEPTLSDDLPGHIASAKHAGFATIGLITNGRRLAYRAYAQRLLASGLNKITLSIHGPTARVHDGLTRTRGSFAQTVAGLDNLVRQKAKSRLVLHTSSVIVKRNLGHLADLVRLLSSKGVDRMCFNAMMAKGRGRSKFDLLMPRYADIAQAFDGLIGRLDDESLRSMALADVPRCAVTGPAARMFGEQEGFDQFEVLGSSGISGVSAACDPGSERPKSGDPEPLTRLKSRALGEPDLRGDADYYLTSRELKDGNLRVKRPECADCIHDSRCPGVWETYVAHHGWDELEAVRKPGAGRD